MKSNPEAVQTKAAKDPLFGSYSERPMDMDQHVGDVTVPQASSHTQVMTTAASGAQQVPTSHPFPSDKDSLMRQSVSRTSFSRRASRNTSILSFGGAMRQSETTFGRAMSGLSALSIDWENLEDFDLEVDHSAHINNQATTGGDAQGDGSKQAVGV